MKLCKRCNQEKPNNEFSLKHPWCKPCKNIYNKSRYTGKTRDKQVALKTERRIKARAFINKLKDNPCKDCSQKFLFCAMQFDHLPQFKKSFDLFMAPSMGKTEEAILAEVAKCELVCANCHAVRTYIRQREVS